MSISTSYIQVPSSLYTPATVMVVVTVGTVLAVWPVSVSSIPLPVPLLYRTFERTINFHTIVCTLFVLCHGLHYCRSVPWSGLHYCRSVPWSTLLPFCTMVCTIAVLYHGLHYCRTVAWSGLHYCRSVPWSGLHYCRSVPWSTLLPLRATVALLPLLYQRQIPHFKAFIAVNYQT